MSKETVESLTKKVNEQGDTIKAVLDLFIADMERQEEEGKNIPMLGELYKLAGHGPEKED